jgi:hypothetical protein
MTDPRTDEQKKEGQEAKEEYLSDMRQIRGDLNTFAIALIVATWVLIDKEIISKEQELYAKLAFIFSIIAIFFNLLSRFLRALHWEAVMNDSSKDVR